MNKDSIKKYLTERSVTHIFWAVGFLVLAVLTFSKDLWFVAVLFFLGSLYNFKRPSKIQKNVDTLFKKYEDAGRMDDVVKDFEDGIYTDNQNLCVGDHMIFSRRLHTIFDYDEVEKFYLCEEEEESDGTTTTYLCLYLQQKTGSKYPLIRLSKSGENQDAMNMACEKIKIKWPSARFDRC